MRWLFWMIRSASCQHEWDLEEKYVDAFVTKGMKVSATCKKCGWHRKYWKF